MSGDETAREAYRSLVNLAAFLPQSRANGPGRRAVVWVQGCPRSCPDCFNQEMIEFVERQIITVDQLACRILSLQGIEGVTFSGGEPFIQAAALATLAELLVVEGLNIVTFTGYRYEELKQGGAVDVNRLLAATDLLVAGPYEKEHAGQQYLLASTNQEFVFLTDRLRE
ncbi:MAG: 4Fe-4S single cluster domain-containing protein, partial [Sporomusa sp.]